MVENHSSWGTRSPIPNRTFETGNPRPAWRLRIGHKDLTAALISARVSYDLGGDADQAVCGSSLELAIDDRQAPARSSVFLQGARVTLDAGWERGVARRTPPGQPPPRGIHTARSQEALRVGTIFSGRLETTDGNGSMLAFGPMRLMGEQRLGRLGGGWSQVSYEGMALDAVVLDLAARAGYGPGVVEIRGHAAADHIVSGEGTVFPPETTLAEVAESLLAPAGFVLFDSPVTSVGGAGGNAREERWKIVCMRRPANPGQGRGGVGRRVFREEDLRPGALEISAAPASYSAVVVFRRDESGNHPVLATAPVETRGTARPAPGRILSIPEFAGDDAQAEQVAYDTARRLELGTRTGSVTTLLDHTLVPFAPLTLSVAPKPERRRDGRRDGVPQRFNGTADRELGFDISATSFESSVGFTAIEET